MHASHRALIAISRQQYWILGVGHAARQVISRCIICFRAKPRFINQMMGNMPPERVNVSRPFYHCGVDFCGPIKTHYNVRGKSPTKSYLAIFVCFSTKAVHIKVVGDLSSQSFIFALKRFIGRRRLCHTIFCDNAASFVGAKSELAELTKVFNSRRIQSSIQTYCLEEGIKWKNIPPRSPHFGGLWEAAVKSAKTLLVRHLGEVSLTYEQLLTVVIQIEAILNSRPLTPLSSDPNDFEALTPGHFLIGGPLTAIAEPDITDSKIGSLNKFRQMQHIQQHFWKRWSAEYLHLLQQRVKWETESNNLKNDTLVLIEEDNIPPMRWKLGRVIETFKGSDNKVRVANVKTQTGTYQRAIQNLCPLPIDELDYPPPTSEPDYQEKNQHEQININKLDDGVGIYFEDVGIYFEDVGRIRTVNTYWKIFVYYNLTTYWQEFDELKTYVNKLRDLCTKEIAHQMYYIPTIDTMQSNCFKQIASKLPCAKIRKIQNSKITL
ncbi:uncharacterized protein LOC129906506 [Episyrphus balteatus]|uniref:uncharacterized protein LOC129906506 n=1 Tax=Episyrphus balteatus TaxID=286459 RepID=UPI002486B621|nr:uncharacterized protein LOC129906506 [Episyrphus balteatus]